MDAPPGRRFAPVGATSRLGMTVDATALRGATMDTSAAGHRRPIALPSRGAPLAETAGRPGGATPDRVGSVTRSTTGAALPGRVDAARAPVGRSTDTGINESIAEGIWVGTTCGAGREPSVTMVTTAALNVADTAAAAARRTATTASHSAPRPHAPARLHPAARPRPGEPRSP